MVWVRVSIGRGWIQTTIGRWALRNALVFIRFEIYVNEMDGPRE